MHLRRHMAERRHLPDGVEVFGLAGGGLERG